MALTVSSGMTKYSDHDAQEFDEGTSTLYIEGMRSGTGYVGYDVDIETLYNFNTTVAPPADMSAQHIGVWLRISNAGSVDLLANGGMQIAVRDSSLNESYWYVGGSDTYSGGWVFFVAYCGNTPDGNNGTPATLTDAADLGVGFKMLAKSADDNCHIDAMYYGTTGLIVTGTTTTAGNGMQEIFDAVNTAATGLLDKQNGVFIGKGPIQFNDDATGTLTLTDENSTFRWADLPVSASWYKMSLGSSSGVTDLTFGSVVGTGDDRQGISGISMSNLGLPYELDFATNLAGNGSNSVKIYGSSFAGAEVGISFDDNSKTTIIAAFTNCNEVDPGATNNGAEILNTFIIDPIGATTNYGLKFPQTPVTGTLTHNCKQISFITSGTPTTQYMLDFVYAGDYSVTLPDFVMYGSFTSGTLWHGINSGSNADIIINSSGTTNVVEGEFSNTASGTVSVIAGSVTVEAKATLKAGTPVETAIVYLRASDGTGPFPYLDSVTIARAGALATVTHTAHGMASNDKVALAGISDKTEDNGIRTITVTGVNSYTYATTDSGSTSYTGTITSTFVALSGLTNASGILSTSRVYPSTQPVIGWTRKSSGSPYLQEGVLVGDISSTTGFSGTAVMLSDE